MSPEPGRAVPIASPDLRDELVDVAALELVDEARIEDVDASSCAVEPGAPIEGLELRRVRLRGAAWTGATLRGTDLRDVVVDGGELSGVTLEGAALTRVAFVRCRMSGFVAPELHATDVRFVDCRLEDAWLRAGTFERVAFEGCTLSSADLYACRIRHSRFERCDLSEVELSQAELDDVAFHGSSIEGLRGGGALRNAVIGGDQLLTFAGPILAAANVRLDDDYLLPPDPEGVRSRPDAAIPGRARRSPRGGTGGR